MFYPLLTEERKLKLGALISALKSEQDNNMQRGGGNVVDKHDTSTWWCNVFLSIPLCFTFFFNFIAVALGNLLRFNLTNRAEYLGLQFELISWKCLVLYKYLNLKGITTVFTNFVHLGRFVYILTVDFVSLLSLKLILTFPII